MKKITTQDAVDMVMHIRLMMLDEEMRDRDIIAEIAKMFAEFGINCGKRPEPQPYLILRE